MLKFKWLLLIAILTASHVWAEDLTPETYTRLNSEARKLTMDGMEKRIALLQNGAANDVQLAEGKKTNLAIDALFKQYDTTSSAHAAYGTYHQKEIDVWLKANPAWQQTEADLTQRFKTLSQKIDGLLGVTP